MAARKKSRTPGKNVVRLRTPDEIKKTLARSLFELREGMFHIFADK